MDSLNIIRDSKNNIYKIYTDKKNNLTIEKFLDKKLIFSNVLIESVKNFNASLDENDMIHIAYLTVSNELKYFTYSEQYIKNLIYTFNTNEIFFLKLKLLMDIPHIFYTAKLNNNDSIPYLFHSYLKNNKWITETLISFSNSTHLKQFFVDKYNNELYIFYCSEKTNKYSLGKLDKSDFSLCILETNILLNECYNIKFLLTSLGNIVICYVCLKNKNLQLYIQYKSLDNYKSNSFKHIYISEDNCNSEYPTMLCEDKIIYIMWIEGKQIIYRKFNISTETLSHKFVFNILSSKTIKYKYISNYSYDKNLKSNYVYTDINSYIHINSESLLSQKYFLNNTINIKTSNNINSNSKINENKKLASEKSNNFLPLNFDKINSSLLHELNKKNEYISTLERIIYYQYKKINHLKYLNKLYKNKQKNG